MRARLSSGATRRPPGTVVAVNAARRSRLQQVKLRALVRDHLGDESVPEADEFAPGAALVHAGVAWVLVAERPASRLGAALAWAVRRDATALHVVAEDGTGVLARRAAEFELPIAVWVADGRVLRPATADGVRSPDQPPPHHVDLRPLIVGGGADPIVEHGVLVGEVRGLEVCRVVDDPHLGTTRLEVGVGEHDREAFQMLHGDVPAVESLARIVETVVEHRRVGAPQHPLNRLAAERFLRWRLIDDPDLVGMREVAPMAPPVPRPNLKDPVPCAAIGTDAAGGRSVIVCTTGVDLDAIPFAADARLAVETAEPGVVGDDVGLIVVSPARDRLSITDELASRLTRPPEIRTIG